MERKNLCYENELGKSFYFNTHDSKIGFQSIEGLDGHTVSEVTSQGYRQHGNTLEFLQLDERTVEITFWFDCKDHSEYLQYRKNAFNVFKPLVEGTLYYEDEVYQVMLKCHVSEAPEIENSDVMTAGVGTVTLVANDPILYDIDLSVREIATWVGGFRTWDETEEFQIPMLQLRQKGDMTVSINNNGQVPVPIEVEFNGQATNPILHNQSTGEFMALDGIINSNEHVRLTTGYRNKTVRKYTNDGNEEGAEYMLRDSSTFFWLKTGTNRLSFITSDSSEINDVVIRFRKGYYSI